MIHRFLFLMLVAMTFVLAGCGNRNKAKSIVGALDSGFDGTHLGGKQLTQDDYPCQQWGLERTNAAMKILPAQMFRNWNADLMNHAKQAIAGIPDHYLGYLANLHKRNGFFIEADEFGATGGVTISNENDAEYIVVTPVGEVVDHVLQHELGHALQFQVRKESGARGLAFEEALAAISDREYDNPNLNDYPHGYDRGSDAYHREFWAEAFNSFYCDRFTNGLLEKQFPGAYPFLLKYLQPPVWGLTGARP